MSALTDVLLWAQRVLARGPTASAHQILELPASATLDEAQDAFQKIARTAHPDLHRRSVSAEELEAIELAYSRASGAYHEFRKQAMQTTRLRPIGPGTPAPARVPTPPSAVPRLPAPIGGVPRAETPGDGRMNAKALLYYRKAELALRRGDLKTALLQMKMAIAGDPQSHFLRTALAEIETELGKK